MDSGASAGRSERDAYVKPSLHHITKLFSPADTFRSIESMIREDDVDLKIRYGRSPWILFLNFYLY